jgi:hypothetical protein
MPARNALDMPTSVGSEMAREYVEPLPTGKANDNRRPSVDASRGCCLKEHSVNGHTPVLSNGSTGKSNRVVGRPVWDRPYEGLSRMKGNFHVRFLEGGGSATTRLYSA